MASQNAEAGLTREPQAENRRTSIGSQRNPASEEAILQAAQDILLEGGLRAFSIEAVAPARQGRQADHLPLVAIQGGTSAGSRCSCQGYSVSGATAEGRYSARSSQKRTSIPHC